MSHGLTESNSYDATITVPDDGDARNAASVNVAFQSLANRTKALKSVATPDGVLIGADRLRVQSTSDTNFYVSKIQSLTLGGVSYSTTGETAVPTGTLVAGTWYYVYAYVSGASLAFEYSTTAPDSDLVYKSTDTTRRYIGCFVGFSYSGTVKPVPFMARRGRYKYHHADAGSGNGTAASTSGTSGVWVTCNVGAFVPPHARVAEFYVSASCTTVGGSFQLRATGDSDYFEVVHAFPIASGTSYNELSLEMVPGSLSGHASIDVFPTAPNPSLILYALGFTE